MPFKNIIGTAAAQAVHGRYIGGALNTIMGSLGMLSKESLTLKSIKPFKAMDEIRQRLSFPGNDGNCLYFKNNRGHQFGPLSGFMAQAGVDQTFKQKTTWGRNFIKDSFEAQWAILFCAADVSDQKPGSTGAQNRGESKGQGRTVYDTRLKSIIEKMNPGGGGKANFHLHDGAFVDKAVAPWAKLLQENIFRAAVKDGPMMTFKVPIQGGLGITCGRGCYLDILPAIGDLTNPNRVSSQSGKYMIAKLCHELFLDDRTMNATTTCEAYKIG